MPIIYHYTKVITLLQFRVKINCLHESLSKLLTPKLLFLFSSDYFIHSSLGLQVTLPRRGEGWCVLEIKGCAFGRAYGAQTLEDRQSRTHITLETSIVYEAAC